MCINLELDMLRHIVLRVYFVIGTCVQGLLSCIDYCTVKSGI